MESINNLTLIKIEIQSRYSQTRKSKQVIEWRKHYAQLSSKTSPEMILFSLPDNNH